MGQKYRVNNNSHTSEPDCDISSLIGFTRKNKKNR